MPRAAQGLAQTLLLCGCRPHPRCQETADSAWRGQTLLTWQLCYAVTLSLQGSELLACRGGHAGAERYQSGAGAPRWRKGGERQWLGRAWLGPRCEVVVVGLFELGALPD